MKILLEMYFWTRKSPLHFGNQRNPGRIRLGGGLHCLSALAFIIITICISLLQLFITQTFSYPVDLLITKNVHVNVFVIIVPFQ